MERINVDVEVLKRLPVGKVLKAVPTPPGEFGCCDCFPHSEAALVVQFRDEHRDGHALRLAYFCIACGTYNGEYIARYDSVREKA